MPDDKNISLREYFDKEIKHLEEKMMMLNAATEKALILKAEENKQHFESLNGEAGRINKILEATIPREVHERDIKELAKDIKALTAHKDVGTGKSMTIAAVIMFILGAIGAAGGVLSLFK